MTRPSPDPPTLRSGAFFPGGDGDPGVGVHLGPGLFVNGKPFAMPAPTSYEWVVWLDELPGFRSRLFKRLPPPLVDRPFARLLLDALAEALTENANVSDPTWHKREILTHRDRSSGANRPY